MSLMMGRSIQKLLNDRPSRETRFPHNDVALLLPSTIPEAARELKDDAQNVCTDCSKRWLERRPAVDVRLVDLFLPQHLHGFNPRTSGCRESCGQQGQTAEKHRHCPECQSVPCSNSEYKPLHQA